jgi:hypothetical protein
MGAKAEEFRANARRLEERADVALEERIGWLCLTWPSASATSPMILNATSLTKLLHGCKKQTLPIRPVASFIPCGRSRRVVTTITWIAELAQHPASTALVSLFRAPRVVGVLLTDPSSIVPGVDSAKS